MARITPEKIPKMSIKLRMMPVTYLSSYGTLAGAYIMHNVAPYPCKNTNTATTIVRKANVPVTVVATEKFVNINKGIRQILNITIKNKRSLKTLNTLGVCLPIRSIKLKTDRITIRNHGSESPGCGL